MDGKTNQLGAQAFDETFVPPMTRLYADDSPETVDIWSYVESMPECDFCHHSINDQDVELAYRSGDGRFDHALIPTHTGNVYLVIVVDVGNASILGQHILDLNEKYGLTPVPEPE